MHTLFEGEKITVGYKIWGAVGLQQIGFMLRLVATLAVCGELQATRDWLGDGLAMELERAWVSRV